MLNKPPKNGNAQVKGKAKGVPQNEPEIFKQGLSWEVDTELMLRKSERRAWIVAGAGSFFGLLGGSVAAFQLFRDPPAPVVLEVDKLSGRLQMLTTLTDEKESYGQASDEHWCQMYLLYRMSYNFDMTREFYVYVGYMSSPEEQQRYHTWFQPNDNPNSPINLYGKDIRVKIKIQSVSPLTVGKTMLIRYVKIFEGANVAQPENWQVIINFKFQPNSKMTKEARLINPYAFQCTGFEEQPDGSLNSKAFEKAGKK